MTNKKAVKRNKPLVAQRKGPSTGMIVGIVVVLLFAAAVGFGLYKTQQGGRASTPPGATASGISVGQDNAKATVDIFLDFQCPVCKQYEAQVGPTVDKLVAAGTAKVVYHPMAFLDRASSSQYSTRSSAAAGCVAGSGVFPRYAKLLYANQPEEGGSGLPDSQLVDLAKQAGAPADVAGCITGRTYAKWTAALTDQASKEGVNATPTVKVNGKQVDNTSAALEQAVQAAQ
jgi:protein-disulfide isomerase